MGYLQYKLRQQELEDRKKSRQLDVALNLLKISTDRDIREKSLELEASKTLYAENQKILSDNRTKLDNLETKYHEAVGSIDNLDEIYHGSGKDVTVDIYKGEATNYQARADQAQLNNVAIENKINALQNVLFTDINRAKQIMAGGAGPRGGSIPDEWDSADLGIVAYEAEYGEASPTVQLLFQNNPGAMMKSLSDLKKSETALELSKSKTEYYGAKGVERGKKVVELAFGTVIKSASLDSGKSDYDILTLTSSQFDENTTPEDIKSNKQNKFKIINQVGEELFEQLLNQNISKSEHPNLVQEYFNMYDHATKDYEAGLGVTAEANYGPYLEYLKLAKDNYVEAIKKDDDNLKRRLNALARKYLGMPYGAELHVFVKDMEGHFNEKVLSELNIIENPYGPPTGDQDPNRQNTVNNEDDFWNRMDEE